MTQPTLILVHGAFATSFSFAPLQAELAFHGVRSAAVDLLGHGFAATFPHGYQAPQDLAQFISAPGSIRGVSLDDNVQALAEAAARAKDNGPVIILAHSRGGAALTALANARPELIDHMVYVSAWAPVALPAAEYNGEPEMAEVDNAALGQALAGDPGELGLLRCNFRQADTGVLEGLKDLFCADVGDDEFRIFLNSLQPDENLDAGGPEHRAQAENWGTIARTFVRLGEDRSIPITMQDRLIREGDALTPDNPYRVRTLASSHVGWLIRPTEAAVQLAQITAEVSGELS
ncbi:alpha/beta fold hydrolase [Brevibacterium limosum]|uniref:alpha/beta fold hydrolase n=1 Tax=Brevibacterium limosum TaxID=2697565 RepID=UPI0014241607|nr:alpha/beta fold hydrolase [Brevibacterium limosum]